MAFSPGIHTISVFFVLIAFTFLLLATISTPIVSIFKLADTSDVSFGVFGYCVKDASCVGATYPYVPSNIELDTSDWFFLSLKRDVLAKLLIVAPILLGLSFFTIIMTFAAHFNPSLLLWVAFVFSLLSFFGAGLVSISSILMFHPHVLWLGWLLIAAAILLLFSTITLLVAALSYTNTDDDDDRDSEFNKLLFNLEPKPAMYTFGNSLDKVPPGFLSYKELDSSSSFERGPNLQPPQHGSRMNNELHLEQHSAASQGQYASAHSTQPLSPLHAPTGFQFSQARVSDESSLNNPRTNYRTYSDTSRSHNAYAEPQLHDSPTIPHQIRQEMAPSVAPRAATPSGPSKAAYSAPYPVAGGAAARFSPAVFEHHPLVEGHRPFAEDFVEDDQAFKGDIHNQDSDVELDFTSVSQRPPNPQSFEPARRPQPPPHNYAPPPSSGYQQYGLGMPAASPYGSPNPGNNAYAPAPAGPTVYAPQQRQPTISEAVLSSNPDFGVAGPPKRRIQPGFVPVSQRAKPGLLASTLMGRR